MSLCRSISLIDNVSRYASASTHPHRPGVGPKSSKAQLKKSLVM